MSDVATQEIDIEELTKSDPEKAAIYLDAAIKHSVSDERENWIMRARMIYYMKTKELWVHHPAGFSSFFEYCGQAEIDIAPSVASDMIALCKYEKELLDSGIDIWDVVRKAGHSKVRQIIPQIREAHRNHALAEEIQPIVDAMEGMSFREVLDLTASTGTRSQYNFVGIYSESQDGEISVTLKGLDIDDLEYLSRKIGLKRWYDTRGNRIEPPMNK